MAHCGASSVMKKTIAVATVAIAAGSLQNRMTPRMFTPACMSS